jgi:uncharacterized protein (TIGR03118 family)
MRSILRAVGLPDAVVLGLMSVFVVTFAGCGDSPVSPNLGTNTYLQHNFVAGSSTGSSYAPSLATNSRFLDAWGIAIRPAGDPGHFWVLAGDTSYEYVGDVNGTPLVGALAPLPVNQVLLPGLCANPPYAILPCPVNNPPDILNNHATGVVFNGTATSFIITQQPTTGAPITANAKFLFATSTGVISGWTERLNADGSYSRAGAATVVIDDSANGAAFYGLAVSPTSDKLYVADFGTQLRLRIWDSSFNEITSTLGFANPFVKDQGSVKAGEYVPWNVQVIGSSVFVMYAQAQEDPNNPGMAYPGNEVHALGAGRLVQFDLNGKQIAIWNDNGDLNAPWGIVQAPANFGLLSGKMLVGNFGDFDGLTSNGFNRGSVLVFDPTTRSPIGRMQGTDGNPLLLPGLWGMTFGNGDTLGDTNALYFASGPQNEADGLFGSIRYSPQQ